MWALVCQWFNAVWSFLGWRQIYTQLTLHTPTCTNLPGIFRLVLKQDSKNTRMNFLPWTTIRLVFGSQTEEQLLNKGKDENQPSHAALSCSLGNYFPTHQTSQTECGCVYVIAYVLYIFSVCVSCYIGTANGWHVAMPLYFLAGHRMSLYRDIEPERVGVGGDCGCEGSDRYRMWMVNSEWSHVITAFSKSNVECF